MPEEHTELAERLVTLASVDPQELVRSADLGEANFASGVPIFHKTLNLFSELEGLDYNRLPSNVAQAIATQAVTAVNAFNQVAEFSLKQDNPTDARDALLAQMEGQYAKHYNAVAQHISYLRGLGDDDVDRRETDELVEQLRVLVEDTTDASQRAKAEINSALESARSAAAEAGVGQQSQVFSEEADANTTQALRWLIMTSVFGIAAFGYAIFAFADIPKDSTTTELVRTSLQRLLLFSLLAFAMGFSARQYRAARHNQTVNKHRAAALRTFETFVQSTAEPAIKDAVLLEATRSIFGAQPTGFLGPTGSDSPSALVEVVQKVAGSDA